MKITDIGPRQALAKVDSGPLKSSDEEASACAENIADLVRARGPFEGSVLLNFGATQPLFVDGALRKVIFEGTHSADAHIEVSPSSLQRVMRGELDVRQLVLFGQLKLVSGSHRVAIEFGDVLSGRSKRAPTSSWDSLPQPCSDWEQAKTDLEQYGYCIVQGALDARMTAALRERAVEQAEAERNAGIALMGAGSSQRIANLINKGKVFHELLHHPLIDRFVEPMLGDSYLLTSYSVNIAGPGNSAGIMHYDQIYLHPPTLEFPVGLNIAWFLDDVYADNGGTRLMPRSHTSGEAPLDMFSFEGTIGAEGPAGSALLIDSRLWHATGSNQSDNPRHVVLSYFNRSYMRTQENYFLSLHPEVFKQCSERVKVMLGYRCTGSLGGVERPVEGAIVDRPDDPVTELKLNS